MRNLINQLIRRLNHQKVAKFVQLGEQIIVTQYDAPILTHPIIIPWSIPSKTARFRAAFEDVIYQVDGASDVDRTVAIGITYATWIRHWIALEDVINQIESIPDCVRAGHKMYNIYRPLTTLKSVFQVTAGDV